MQVILLALGIAALLAGVAMVGFGIPINEFGIGNTLILAGTTAIVGGLILIGLWVVAREVVRIAETLDLRFPRGAPKTANKQPPEASLPTGVEAPVTGSSDVADLSRVLAEPPVDFSAPPDPALTTTDPFAPAKPDSNRTGSPRARGFDAIWSRDPARAPKPSRAAETPKPAERNEPVDPASPAPEAVTILKSGVIEGMAYTLYSDGSIEADLKQGMVRFSSIDDLRRHLAQQG